MGHLKGLLKAITKKLQEETLIEILVSEAIKTSEIENEYLSREDVTSSIRHNLGLFGPKKEVKDIRAKGIGKLMTEVRKKIQCYIKRRNITKLASFSFYFLITY